jgi:hypothetical protein
MLACTAPYLRVGSPSPEGRWPPVALRCNVASMISLALIGPKEALAAYGYLAVFALVGIEGLGVPFPGETMLVTAAIYAGTTGVLSIAFVIAAAVGGPSSATT